MNRQRWTTLIVVAVVAAGAWFRLDGLGRWPFTEDEYFVARSIRNILDHGLPVFPCGGYYARGLLYQYLGVPLLALGIADEGLLRSLSVLANLAAMPAVFALGRRLGGRRVGLLALTFFALSTWEVEMARFARMYAPFQALFAGYLVVFVRVVVDGRRRELAWLYGLSLIGPLVYEGAVFMAMLNPLAVLLGPARRSGRHWAAAAAVAAAVVGFLKTDFRFMGSERPVLDAAAPAAAPGLVELPSLTLGALAGHPGWVVGWVLLAAFNLAVLLVVRRRDDPGPVPLLVLGAAVLASLGHQLGLAALILGVGLLLDWLPLETLRRHRPVTAAAAALVALNGIAWVAFLLSTPEGAGSSRGVAVALLKYPNLLDPFVYRYLEVMPVQLVVFLALALVGTVAALRGEDRQARTYRLLAATTWLVLAAVGILRTHIHSTRYTFFLYPLLLVLVAGAIERIVRGTIRQERRRPAAALLLTVGVMALGEDYRPGHLLRIASPEFNFRTVYDNRVAEHYYLRRDVRGPAEFVNARLKPGEQVVITVLPADYYLDRVDAFFMEEDNPILPSLATCHSLRERWTDAELITSRAALERRIATSTEAVWLLVMDKRPELRNALDRWIVDRYGDFLVARGWDERIAAYRVPPGNAPRTARIVTESGLELAASAL